MTSYSVTSLAPNTTQTYAVKATNGNGYSANSSDVTASSLVLQAPTNLVATAASTALSAELVAPL